MILAFYYKRKRNFCRRTLAWMKKFTNQKKTRRIWHQTRHLLEKSILPNQRQNQHRQGIKGSQTKNRQRTGSTKGKKSKEGLFYHSIFYHNLIGVNGRLHFFPYRGMSTLKYQGTLEFPAWNFQAILGGFPPGNALF